MSSAVADDRIRSLRPAKPYVDPFAAHGSVVEEERRPDGTIERALTVFLAGAECPFTCSFCDLWRYTTDGATPNGALPAQLRRVLDGLDAPLPDRVKLYNASNFFDRRAVPPGDVPAIAELSRGFSGVTVESHVNTIGEATVAFSRLITGRLEVAVGLETIHPLAATRINKRLDLARFEKGARFLADHAIDLRVFVLLGAPHVPAGESVEWTVRTVEHAVQRCTSAHSPSSRTETLIGSIEPEQSAARSPGTSSSTCRLQRQFGQWLRCCVPGAAMGTSRRQRRQRKLSGPRCPAWVRRYVGVR